MVQVLEDKVEFHITVDDVKQVHDVGVLKLLEQRDLPDGGARNTFTVTASREGKQCMSGSYAWEHSTHVKGKKKPHPTLAYQS